MWKSLQIASAGAAVVMALVSPVQAQPGGENSVDELLEVVLNNERQFVEQLRQFEPLLETYVQELPGSRKTEEGSIRDHYFLGRLANADKYIPIVARSDRLKTNLLSSMLRRGTSFIPSGFARMTLLDAGHFDRAHYTFEFVRREFLGELRCLVFDVAPVDKKVTGRFLGRVWVEDKGLRIVRFNGTYTNSTSTRLFFHFDSWRLNVAPGVWVPAFVYVEESNLDPKSRNKMPFKAQSRLWGYAARQSDKMEELTKILVTAEPGVSDRSAKADLSPLESQRFWVRQAEVNILDKLEKSGLLAPAGEVDRILNTVVNNLIATNNLTVEARCRVLLTTPLESFAIGNTIVISRGLIDVLPDEASLAMLLADELAHIVLGHRTNTQFAFINQTMLTDEETLQRFRFQRTRNEMEAAGKKAIEMLEQSPYKQKMTKAGLFLKALSSRAPALPNLIRSNMGNQLASGETLVRLADLMEQAPPLEEDRLDQIAALPLGSRVKLDPWANAIALLPARPVSLLSATEKMPFEIAPFMPNLTRHTVARPVEQIGDAVLQGRRGDNPAKRSTRQFERTE